MKNTIKRTFLIGFATLIPLFLVFMFYSTVLAQQGDDITSTTETDPSLIVEIGADNAYVLLENSQIRVRYEPFYENHYQFGIREFVYKTAGLIDQAGAYLDADEFRGTLKSASLVYDGTDRKTVQLVWNTRDTPGHTITHQVTIFANRPFLKIDYVDVDYGINIVDMGMPGGTDHGTHVAYGGDTWIRGYVTQYYTPTVGSYYNRYPEDHVNDPANGGSLNYHGHFIVGVYKPNNKIGYGRVMPVARTPIIKLLVDDTHRRGIEFLPLGTNLSFTGYIYPVVGGPDEIIEMGKMLADGNYGNLDAATFQSDDFKRCTWQNGLWTYSDPVGDSSIAHDGSQIRLSVPGGVDHDIWGTGLDFQNRVARLMQPSANTDFEIEVKFTSGVTSTYQVQGILVRQDVNDWMRFEFEGRDTYTGIFVGRIMDGTGYNLGGVVKNIGLQGVRPLYLRVRRLGNLWTTYYSLDGMSWQIYTTVVSTMTVSEVGVFAGNTSKTGPPPAHTAIIDYFFNTTNPISPEDGNLNSITVHLVGNGSVQKNPIKVDYTCGESVSLLAQPNPGWSFGSWSGDVTGTSNPTPLIISGAHTITATFTQNQYTLAVNKIGHGNVLISPEKATYTYNETVTLTAVPDSGWKFTGWSGAATGNLNPTVVTITGNANVTATFEEGQIVYSMYLPSMSSVSQQK